MQVMDENQPNNFGKMASKPNAKKSKTIEETYTKMTQLEHILLRPDTYIGSIEKQTQQMWVFDSLTKKMVPRQVTYVPGLFKIFDEIVVNAADNKQRDPNMNRLEVTIDVAENKIRVWNNGRGIPVAIHQEHQIYVPELIFGNLLTGSNFDDKEEKTTGGRNGYGAKLANIFSTKFVVETADSSRGLKFVQEFRNNMGTKDTPRISKYDGTDYTCITFYPDLSRFRMDYMDDDIFGILAKRVYDIAATNSASGSKLRVTLNGERVEINRFEQYLELFQGIEQPVYFERISDRWEIGVGVSDGSFQHISFVNSISTTKGGTHVNFIADKIIAKLAPIVKKKNKGEEVKPNQIKNHLAIFVNALIVNPAFDSQTKENLTTKAASFGSSCEIPDKMIKAIEKSSIIENILNWSKLKQTQELKKKSGTKQSKLLGITKLDDANFAGTSKSSKCTLILTEGDSAKALAISGLGVVGRDYYGVFPLRGKLLNVREATHKQMMNNEEIQNITKILGLTFGKQYDDISSLRYGHLMIMTDQDHDGSHIKGLLINFLHFYWPSLLRIEGFLQQFITPIVKVSKGKSEVPFYTIPEYRTWKENHGDGKGWKIKYYKGLGTSTAAEAKDYFSNLVTHEIDFSWDENADDMIEMAFSKKRVEDRKLWLLAMEPGVHIDYKAKNVTYDNFVNHELILFSHADNERSIAHFMDGMKPSQRKVLFACFKRNLKQEIKVAQLAGYVSEHSAYHHGEASLTQTIIGMAQNFVGSNNINLLSPCGQFGTRLMGGKDAASPRYVFTKLETITRSIFHPDDDALLEYLEDDGQSIEPLYYVPIIPMALVNGCEGIGTGWSSSVPTFNPREIIANLKLMIQGDEPVEMLPWYRGFTGTVQQKAVQSYVLTGTLEQLDDQTVRISELPVGKWTTDYKQYLESVLIGNTAAASKDKDDAGKEAASVTPFVKDFKENHTDTSVLFTVTAPAEKLVEFENEKGGLIKKFKLDSTISTSNMHLFDLGSQIKKYEGPLNLLKEFFYVRMQYYDHRKTHLISKLTSEWEKLDNKVRFLLAVIRGDIVVSNRKKSDLLNDLKRQGLKTFYESKDRKNKSEEDDNEESDENADSDENGGSMSLERGYDYLLSMKLWNLTMEKVHELTGQRNNKRAELDELIATSAESLWIRDLNALESALDDYDATFDEAKASELTAQRRAQKKSGIVVKKPKKPLSKVSMDSEDDNEGNFDNDSEFDEKPKKKKTVAPAPAKKTVVSAPVATIAPVSRVVSESSVASTASISSSISASAPASKPQISKKPAVTGSMDKFVAKPTTVVPSVAPPTASEDPAEGAGLSLMQRLKLKAAATTTTATATATATTTVPSIPVLTSIAPAAVKKALPVPKATAAKPAVTKTKPQVIALDEEEDKDEFAAPSTPPATKRAPRAAAQKKIAYVESDKDEASFQDDASAAFDDEDDASEDFDDDSDDYDEEHFDGKKKKKATSAAAAKPAASVAKKPTAAAKPAVAKAANKTSFASPKAKKRMKRNKDEEDMEDDDASDADSIGAKKTKAQVIKKKVTANKKKSVESDEEDAFLASPVPTPQPMKKSRVNSGAAKSVAQKLEMPKKTVAAAASKKATKGKKKAASDDEEDTNEAPILSKQSPKPQRQRKVTNYANYYDDDEDDMDSFVVDEESEFDD